jgi:hypothetical protein
MARRRVVDKEVVVSEHLEVRPVAPVSGDANGPFAKWLRSMWRPLAAVTYLAICIFDFIIAPYYVQAQPHDLAEIFKYVLQMPVEQQSEALNIMMNKGDWQSLTLQGGGLFHIAFGAILGAAAWTRGMEKRERVAVEKSSSF